MPKNIAESPELMVSVSGTKVEPEIVIVSIVAFALLQQKVRAKRQVNNSEVFDFMAE
jgi:hypothetical protein